MGFLDKVKDVGEKAADKAKQATAAGKEKYEDVKLGKKVDELCEEIGKLTVAKRRGDAPAEADTLIEAKIIEALDLEKQIEANKLAGDDGDAPAEGTEATG